ncbi:MAG: peptidase T, partial [Apilactobacillus kunkeei]|nr:peptidase T [Apilactobacillus kunkeei]
MSKYEDLVPRFLRYVKINTRSDESSTTIPSANRETVFLNQLKEELKEIGLSNVRTNEESAYVFATLPSNIDKDVKKIGFISHIDTADFNSENVNPQFVENYDGKSNIKLGDGEYNLDPNVFESLHKYSGDTLITTDGTTLLGADDKSGVSEIISSMKYLIDHPEIKHGEIEVGFGPDEEIGTGSLKFDVEDFGADMAYTVDGGAKGQLQYETFNAAG